MTNFARIINNVAVDVSTDPSAQFHPTIAAEFVSVPDTVQPGWYRKAGEWHAPAPTPQPEPTPETVYPTVGPIHFKMLFTSAERLKAKELRATDVVLADFWDLIDDPRTDVVNLALSSVQDAVEYTLQQCLLNGVQVDVPVRKAAILSGVLQ